VDPSQLAQLPPWLEQMRSAMASAIQPDALKNILQKQVDKALAGDTRAAGFVVEQAHKLIGGEQRRPIAITQNNFYGDATDPAQPTTKVPGTPDKVDLMRRRHAAGLPLTSAADRDPRVIDDDEEEKRLRREQELDESEAA
jgi:hypothetical protein